MSDLPEIRIRTKISEEEMQSKVGLILTDNDYNFLVTRDCRVLKPNGQTLLVYRPGAIPEEQRDVVYPILHSLRHTLTNNRGNAGGSVRVPHASGRRSDARRVASLIVGSFDKKGPRQYCRLTAWTGKETEQFRALWPMLQRIGERMEEDAPDRWRAQMEYVRRTNPAWVIEGTPFTTVTVNNTYPTGVHKDAGDLDSGISALAVLRRGEFRGCRLVLPEYRVAVDMQDGDVLLMDAHEWHGNTQFDPPVMPSYTGHPYADPGFVRISVVAYYRTNMTKCGSPEDEAEQARVYAENRNAAMFGE